jgi:hypothetical protein
MIARVNDSSKFVIGEGLISIVAPIVKASSEFVAGV